MNMAWGIVGGLVIASAIFGFGVRVGAKLEENATIKADLTRADKVIVKQTEVIREVPKIVTRVVTKEVTVEKEVERVIVASHKLLAPDCVLPDNFGMLLVAAANGADPGSSATFDAYAGGYGCTETLAAILSDLRAGWRNSARLEGLQEWAKLVTTEAPTQ
jgi:3-oxoacyl-[acyl-carrier-protein] synthase III